jgi:hypothetical protein
MAGNKSRNEPAHGARSHFREASSGSCSRQMGSRPPAGRTASKPSSGQTSSKTASVSASGDGTASGSKAPPQKIGPRSARTSKKSKTADKSELADLEPELIQEMMLNSLEPNLGEASLSLGKALSSEEIYKVFILFAFFENDEKIPIDDDSPFKPTSYQCLTRAQRVHLQKDILECQWCIYSRIKQCIDTLLHLAIAHECKLHHQAQLTNPHTYGPPIAVLDDKSRKAFAQEGCLQDPRTDVPCTLIRQRRPRHPQNSGNDPDLKFEDAITSWYIPRLAPNSESWNDEATEYLLFIRWRLTLKPAFEVTAFSHSIRTRILTAPWHPFGLAGFAALLRD